MPFRDHLRADQNIRLARGKLFQYFIVSLFRLRRIAVHPENLCRGKHLLQFHYDALRPRSAVPQVGTAAIRAGGEHFIAGVAVMAFQGVFIDVIGQRNVALLTFGNVTAFRTDDGLGVPSLIQK